MQLSELLRELSYRILAGDAHIDVRGLAWDSRHVQPGDAFFAIRGVSVDGHRFLRQAVAAGATALVVEQDAEADLSDLPAVTLLGVVNTREALAWAASALHDYPARRLRVVGVTGTDGKTTTVNLIWSILRAAGHSTGMISTVNAQLGDTLVDTGLHTTTPDAPDVQRYLAEMAAAGLEYAVLEATSHGLAQDRVTGCEQDVAVVTNITHEHLDFHGDYAHYRDAKALLFRRLATTYRKPGMPKVAVLNRDDSSFDYLSPIATESADVTLTYGMTAGADLSVTQLQCRADGMSFVALTPNGAFPIRSQLVGPFNVSNILASMAVALSQGVAPEHIQQGIESLKGVIGRMDRIDRGQDFTAIVDFAHTPNALESALQTARLLTQDEVIVVFGSAGLRDVEKRGLMGHVAGRLADRVIITAEDPRTESLDAIMAAIAEGCEAEGKIEGQSYWRIGDRGEAIQFGINMAHPGDLVIVAGKGHEKSMCYGTVEMPWSDHDAVETALHHRVAGQQCRLP
jgi:UDP-N-acetylmuramoyl-L-alanyl-D-glutamate--2,6-diaminopimelate ligase